MSQLSTRIGPWISVLVSIMILTVACSRSDIGSEEGRSASSATWSVEFSVSGGFAGVRQRLEVYQNGRVISVDEKLKKSVTSNLDQQDFAEMQKLVEWRTATLSSSPEKSRDSNCYDCYNYTVVSTLNGKRISRQYGGLNIARNNERKLIQLLSKVLHEQLSSRK